MRDRGINEPGRARICQIVKDLHLGEENVHKFFLKNGSDERHIKKANSKQKRAVIFKRTIIKRDIRKKFDKRMQYISLVFVAVAIAAVSVAVC